jgi:hypothetical protein
MCTWRAGRRAGMEFTTLEIKHGIPQIVDKVMSLLKS